MKKNPTIVIALLASFVLGAFVAAYIIKGQISNIPEPDFHEHADFALFIDGQRFDFSKDEYMSVQPCTVSREYPANVAYAHGLESDDLEDSAHLHDRNGTVVHAHKPGVAWHDFFESLNMEFDDGEFVDDQGGEYLANEGAAFYYFVNGEAVEQLANREIRDLDQVLISYSSTGEITQEELLIQQAQITNNACFYSEACQHRGPAPYESCGAAHEDPAILKWLGL